MWDLVMIYLGHAQLSLAKQTEGNELLSFKIPKDRYNLSVTFSGARKGQELRNIPLSYSVISGEVDDEISAGSLEPGVISITVMTKSIKVNYNYDLILSEDMEQVESLGCTGRLILPESNLVITKNLGLHYGCDTEFDKNSATGADCYRGNFKAATSFGGKDFELRNGVCFSVYEQCRINDDSKKEYHYSTDKPGHVSMKLVFSVEEYLPRGTASVFIKTSITGVPSEINRYMFDVNIPATPSQNIISLDLGVPVKFKMTHYTSEEVRKDKEVWTKLSLDVDNITGEPCTAVIVYQHPRTIKKIEDDPTEAEQAGIVTGSRVTWCYQYDCSQSVDLFIL